MERAVAADKGAGMASTIGEARTDSEVGDREWEGQWAQWGREDQVGLVRSSTGRWVRKDLRTSGHRADRAVRVGLDHSTSSMDPWDRKDLRTSGRKVVRAGRAGLARMDLSTWNAAGLGLEVVARINSGVRGRMSR